MKGNREAIVSVVRTEPHVFGERQPFAAIASAKQILFDAAARAPDDRPERTMVAEARKFLDDLAAALIYVSPDLRTRAILVHCANLTNHLRRAQPMIIETPRAERTRPKTLARLSKATKLDPEVVARIAGAPRTGILGLARELTGKRFAVSEEHVRKLQRQKASWKVVGDDLIVLGGRKRR